MTARASHPASVRVAVKTAVERTELKSFPWPGIGPGEGVLRVEACGVGGAEPEVYRGEKWVPISMGHQVVGTIEAMDPLARTLWKVEIGERVALQEYLPCKACSWCLRGEYRFCPEADFMGAGKPRRFGLMDFTEPPHLVGGFAEYMHLPWNTVIHKIPQDLPPALATLAIPIGNGVQWATLDVNAGPGKTVLIIGPGQQGLGAVMAAKEAGADKVILAGHTRDQVRLDLSLKLGADHAIDTLKQDLVDAVRTIADGVDVVVDTTGDPGAENLKRYLELANQGAWLWVNCIDSGVPVRDIKKKYLTVRSGRGRTHQAVERALQIIRSRKYPLELMCTHTFGLEDVDLAIRATAGKGVEGAVHVIVDPWKR
ncbi:MAG: alcohol dehydrogenase catalytic domain-containing protein [Hyphomonadaceae bacterium]|nr:alcohol dehydrogenase catalytic domain-containing protein [Hyphomonadaceae bacterium]